MFLLVSYMRIKKLNNYTHYLSKAEKRLTYASLLMATRFTNIKEHMNKAISDLLLENGTFQKAFGISVSSIIMKFKMT